MFAQIRKPALAWCATLCATPFLVAADEAPLEAPIPAESGVAEVFPTAEAMPVDAIRERIVILAEGRNAEEIRQLWEMQDQELPARQRHDLLLQSLAVLDPKVNELLAYDLLAVAPQPLLIEIPLADSDPFVRVNLRLAAGRQMTEVGLFDESLEILKLETMRESFSLAVDPATALFCQAVCEHQLLLAEEGLKTLDRFDAIAVAPERYRVLARIMRAELERFDPESLQQVAGLMRDVERRLRRARGGERVQEQETEIVERLDQMIEEIEKQMQQASSSGSQPNNSNQSQAPADDSTVKGATAPGEVDEKEVRRTGGWGDLSPRERESLKSELERSFSGNYGRLSEDYFTEAAKQDAAN